MRIRRAPLFLTPAEIDIKEQIRRELELLRELSRRGRAAGNRAALNLSATRRAEANMANRPGTATVGGRPLAAVGRLAET